MLRLLLKLLIAATAYYFAWQLVAKVDVRYAAISVLPVSWICVHIFATDLLNFFMWFTYLGKRSALLPKHGKCYVFDGHEFGFYLYEGIIWVTLKDLQWIIKPAISERELRLIAQEYGKIPEQNILGMTEAGLMQILKSRTESRHASTQVIRFKNWLTTHAFVNVKRLPSSSVNYRRGA